MLAVSRAFGDRLLKQYVVADPDIQVHFMIENYVNYHNMSCLKNEIGSRSCILTWFGDHSEFRFPC